MGRTQFYRGALSAFEQASPHSHCLSFQECRDASYSLAFLWGLLRPSYEMMQEKVHDKPKKETGGWAGSMREVAGHCLFFTALNAHQENPSTAAVGSCLVTYHPYFTGSKLRPIYSALSPVWTKGAAAEPQGPALSILKWASFRILPWDLEA